MNAQGEPATPAGSMPSYATVLRTRGVLPIFASSTLSAWGDSLTRITVTGVVYQRTGSAFAAAATLAVSILPTIVGRGLLGPLADRIAYKHLLITVNLLRALLVGVLILAVAAQADLWMVLGVLFVSELIAGPAVAAGQMMWVDLLKDRRRYAKALGLGSVTEQANQVIGYTAGGLLLALYGPMSALWFDVATFALAAIVVSRVARVRPLLGTPSAGLGGFLRDIGEGAAYLFRDRVLVSLLCLSLAAVWGLTAPEAVAYAYAADADAARLGGLLMACPILGAIAGLLVVARWQPAQQNERMIFLALLMPLPLLVTIVHPPVWVAAVLWFASGVLQAFMLPLQATFSLAIPPNIRGRVFGLAGALSVASSGVAFLVAGWLADRTSTAAAVAILALFSLVATVLVFLRWPRAELRATVATAYGT